MMDSYTETGKIYTKRRRKNGFQQPNSGRKFRSFNPGPRPRPRPKANMMWVIAISEDGTEHCLTGKDNWDRQPKLRIDIGGRPMRVIHTFEASSYEEARKLYEDQL